MRIMLDTNVLISAFVLPSRYLTQMIDCIAEDHTIVLPAYVIDELKRVTKRKFAQKYDLLELFLRELPFELVYTPERIDPSKYPDIRDMKDLPILVSAIIEDVDVLISGDDDFAPLELDHPEILTPKGWHNISPCWYSRRLRCRSGVWGLRYQQAQAGCVPACVVCYVCN